ncbi:MAG: sugar transferase [Candidatus Aegiribacteria sp.]|nr:sugar transferase [Candidatus Aegiribacteria sp.]
MKKNGTAASFLLPLGDFILIVGVFILGYWLRHFALSNLLESMFGISNYFRLGLWNYIVSGSVMACMELMMFRTFRVYRQEFGIASVEELSWILRVSFIAVIITFAFTFASRQLMFSRFVLIFAFPTTSIAIYAWHGLFHRFFRWFSLKSGRGIKVAFYGYGSYARELEEYMQNNVSIPYMTAGFITYGKTEDSDSGEVLSFETDSLLFGWLHENGIDELIITEPELSREDTASLLYNCEQENISYKLIADISDLVTRTTRVIHMGGITMIESVPPPLSGSSMILKRIFDILLTIPIMIILLPLGFLIAAAIVIDSGFPVFYVQTRLGREHRKFRLVKFRSMKVGAHAEKNDLLPEEKHELLSKLKQDPRVTRVGRFIRKFSLDELPQLLNVLAGTMSLVGPRPHVPEEVKRYSIKHFKKLEVLPGMTGVCQVSGRNDLSYREMVKLDLYYVDNWSIWMDLSILTMTVPAILLRRGAY